MNCHYCNLRLNTSLIKNTGFCEPCKAYQGFNKGILYAICFMFDQNNTLSDQSHENGYWITIHVQKNQYSLELNNQIIMEHLPDAHLISPKNVQDTVERLLKLKVYI